MRNFAAENVPKRHATATATAAKRRRSTGKRMKRNAAANGKK